MESHTHSGSDGSKQFFNNGIQSKTGTQLAAGYTTIADFIEPAGGVFDGIQRGYFIVGNDENAIDGFDNGQLTVEHQKSTNNSTNQTFLYGVRGKGYVGSTGEITSGGTTMSQTNFAWEVDRLTGHFIDVFNPSGEWDTFLIASNTADTITITGGTWSFSSTNDAPFIIWVPMYLGAANYPWRRVYTMDTSAGGVRFGGGDTNGGQNTILYTEGDVLKFRLLNGTVKTVTLA